MSTSSSDGSGGPADAPEKGVGVSGLFAKAVAAKKAKGPADEPVRAGVENLVCAHCGAPRKQQERLCTYCGERI